MKLQIKVPFLVVGILLIIGIISGGMILYYHWRASVSQFEQMAMVLAGAVRGSLEQNMLTGERTQTQEALAYIAKEKMVKEVVLFAPSGTVAASSEFPDVGKIMPSDDLRYVLQSGEVSMRAELYDRKRELWVLTPIFNRKECQSCHSPGDRILGVIKVSLDATPLDNQAKKETFFIGILGVLSFTVIGASLAFALKRAVLNPISKLTISASKLSLGDYSERVNDEKNDEPGILAKAFNVMAASIEQRTRELEASRQELARWNLGLEDRIQQRTKELSALNAVITAVSQSFNLRKILNDALPIILEAVRVEGGSVHTLDESGQFTIIAHHGFSSEYIRKIDCLRPGQAIVGNTVSFDHPIIVNDYSNNPRAIEIAGFGAYVSFPMKSNSRVLGVLTLASHSSNAFNAETLRLVSAIADALGIAVDNARAALKLEEANKIREDLLKKLISAQEEERRRIARELHDDASQSLAALAISLETISEDLPEQYQGLKKRLDTLNEQAIKTLGGIRTLALELRPSALDDLGLGAAIDWYARDYLAKRGLNVKIEVQNQKVKLPANTETMLFRIVQEALTNIVKHAEATQVKVMLNVSDSSAVVQIQDNGKGFDVEVALRKENVRQHLGLLGMAERVALLDGKFVIESQPEGGTYLRIEVPVKGDTVV
ncbi:MAG: Histidine kinase [Dehalococcoidia bacterium]|nr:Histidine kinase [Dehalococcoidia bacterium]MBF8304399.1 Histidine kinase [Dehalococcoidia bacterium]